MKLQKNFLLFLFLPFFMNQCNNNFSSEGEQTTTKPPPSHSLPILRFQENLTFSIPLEGKKEPKVAFAHLDSDNKKDLMIVSLKLENQNQPDKTNQFLVSSYLSTNQSSYVFQNKIQSSLNFLFPYSIVKNIKQVEIVDAYFEDSKPELHIIGQTDHLPEDPSYYIIAQLSQGTISSEKNIFFTSLKDGRLNAFTFGKLCTDNRLTPIFISNPNIMALGELHYGNQYRELSHPIAIAASDFTKDGIQDLLVLNQETRNLTFIEGATTASCLTGIRYTIELPPEAKGQNGLQVADLNQDGNMDIIISGYESKNISILWGQGTDVFKTFTHIDTTESPLVMKVVDLDQDGKLDIIVATSKHIKILYPNGKIQTIASFELPLNISDLWVLDQNNDGKLDIWLEHMLYDKEVNRFIGHLSLWINQST